MNPFTIEDLDPSGDLRQSADDAGAWDPQGTRRNLLRKAGIGGAAVFGVDALLSPLDALASATSGQKGAYSTQGSRSIRRGAPNANDVKIGNYALTLEYLEAAFYAAAGGGELPRRGHRRGRQDARRTRGRPRRRAEEGPRQRGRQGADGQQRHGRASCSPTRSRSSRRPRRSSPSAPPPTRAPGRTSTTCAIVKAALSIHSVEANHAAYTAALVKFKGIDASADPIPNAFNPAFSFNKTIRTVTGPGPRHGRSAAVGDQPHHGSRRAASGRLDPSQRTMTLPSMPGCRVQW